MLREIDLHSKVNPFIQLDWPGGCLSAKLELWVRLANMCPRRRSVPDHVDWTAAPSNWESFCKKWKQPTGVSMVVQEPKHHCWSALLDWRQGAIGWVLHHHGFTQGSLYKVAWGYESRRHKRFRLGIHALYQRVYRSISHSRRPIAAEMWLSGMRNIQS